MNSSLFKRIKKEKYKLEVGQIWKYKTRKNEEASRLTILKVRDITDSKNRLVHIALDNLMIRNGEITKLEHLVFLETAIQKSIVENEGIIDKLPDFQKEYDHWLGGYKAHKTSPSSKGVKQTIETIDG